jgi:hypothetical protein
VSQDHLEKQHAELLAACEQARAAGNFGASWIKHAQLANGCKVCQRPFGTPEEQRAFIARFVKSGCVSAGPLPGRIMLLAET